MATLTRARRTALLAAAWLSPLWLGAFVEGALRWRLGAPPRPPLPANFEYAHLDIHRPLFGPAGRFGPSAVLYRNRRPRSRPESFVMPKASGAFRAFVVGGSVATEVRSPLEGFLTLAAGSRPVEVLGAGMDGYDSRRDRLVLEEVLGYQPDLVVVMSGNNEYFDHEVEAPRRVLLRHRLLGLWLFQRFERWFGAGKNWERARSGEELEKAFETHLRSMAVSARTRGAAMAVCTLPANLRHWPPSHRPLPMGDERFFEGWRRREAGDHRGAAEWFRRYLEADPTSSHGHFYLAKSLEALGRSEAAAHFAAAADLNVPGDRATPRRNAAIRRIAAEHGLILVDLEREFRALSRDGAPGNELLRDPCHWHPELTPLVDLYIVRALFAHERSRGTPLLAPASAWDLSWSEGLESRALEASAPDSYGAIRNVALTSILKAISWPQQGLDEQAVAGFERVLAAQPWLMRELALRREPPAVLADIPVLQGFLSNGASRWPSVLVHAGEAFRRRGDAATAGEAFELARGLDPRHAEARLRWALSAARSGRRDEALRELEALEREFPKRVELGFWKRHLFAGART